jgi:hypothetical protein
MNILHPNAQTNWVYAMIVVIFGVLLSTAVYYSFVTTQTENVELAKRQVPIMAPKGGGVIEIFDVSDFTLSFSGSVARGQTFEKELENGLVFRLVPLGGGLGIDWSIFVGTEEYGDENYSFIVTPPYRGVNHIYVAGWHFRNSDNSGPNTTGPKNVNAPGETRRFDFVVNERDYEIAVEALDKMLWPGNWSEEEVDLAATEHARLNKGHGILEIMDLELGNLIEGERAWIEHMAFDVELIFPQVTSEWQTYRNEEFGFEIKYPPNWHVAEGSLAVRGSEIVLNLLFNRRPFPTPEECDWCWMNGEYWDGNPHPWDEMQIFISEDPHANEELLRTQSSEPYGDEEFSVRDTYETITFHGLPSNKRINLVYPYAIGDPASEMTVFNMNGNGWSISLPTDYKGVHDPVYDQILSTFRFIDS